MSAAAAAPPLRTTVSAYNTKNVVKGIEIFLEKARRAHENLINSYDNANNVLRRDVNVLALDPPNIKYEIEELERKKAENDYLIKMKEQTVRQAMYNRERVDPTTDLELTDLNMKKVTIDRELAEYKSKLQTYQQRLQQVPNETLYTDAFNMVIAATKHYAELLSKIADEEYKLRKDGKLISDGETESGVNAAYDDLKLKLDIINRDIRDSLKKLFIDSINIDNKNVENSDVRKAVMRRVLNEKDTTIARVIRMIDSIHEDVKKKLTTKLDFKSAFAQFDVGILYSLKLARIGLLWVASEVATRAFQNIYVDRVSASVNYDVPDLKWLVGGFFATSLMFDIIVVGVAYFVSGVMPSVNSDVIKDYTVDTVVSHSMSIMSLLPLANVVQDKRYFEYNTSATRALRLMKQLCFSVSAVHCLIPYFYLTGPFYIQYKMAAVSDPQKPAVI